MPDNEPTNLVLEQLRQMRAETSKRFDGVETRLGGLEADMQDLKKDLRGLKVQTIAEIYKANLTVASFADMDQRR